MGNKIRFVILGSGNISNTYVSAINKIHDAEVVGVVSRSLKSPQKFPELKSYGRLQDIDDSSYDAVIVCTPNGLHHDGTIEAAKLGKHVLCEKPIDISISAAENMISECRQNNVKLGVSYQRRFASDNPIVKQMINEQLLGRIFSVDLAVKYYRDDDYYNSAEYRGAYEIDGGGPFIQQASHYIDLYYWLFGRPKKMVSKLNTFVHDIEVEDHGVVICEHDSGMIGTIIASTATKPGFPGKLELFSDKGFLIMENDVITKWEIEGIDNPSHSTNQHSHTGSSTAVVDDTQNHELLIKDFIDSINSNRDPLVTGESAKISTEIILDIYNNQF